MPGLTSPLRGAVYTHPLLLLWCRLVRLDSVVLPVQQPDLVGGKRKEKKREEEPLQEGVKYEGQWPIEQPGRRVMSRPLYGRERCQVQRWVGA